MKPYKTIAKAVVGKNPWWKYCCDQIELPSGKSGEYHYVLTNGSSMVIPETSEGKLLLVRQYRYTGNRDSLEFPCGGVKEGATHDDTARTELAEETGYLADHLEPVGSYNPCNGLVDEICRVYIARNLRHVGSHPDESESFELVWLTVEEVEALIRDGTIWDGMTLAAWAIVRPLIGSGIKAHRSGAPASRPNPPLF
jgi:ADP-ribose pyrophosphatase